MIVLACFAGSVLMSEMKGKICTITGSNSGIGKETTLSLAKMGATVVMVVRDQERGEKARTEIVRQTGNNSRPNVLRLVFDGFNPTFR